MQKAIKGDAKVKATGIVRKLDDLGRIVLPIELRRLLDLEVGSSIEIYTDNDSIVLKKYQPSCIFCGGEGDLKQYNNRSLCKGCREEIQVL